jgi:hypothetical protein
MAATIAKYQAVQRAVSAGRPGAAVRLAGLGGFGATGLAFDAEAVWADWAAQTNASTTRAAKAVQAALSQLGYNPKGVDGKWGPDSGKAYLAFSAAQGTTTNGINPTYDGIAKIGELLKTGAVVGPDQPVIYHQDGDVYVPTAVGGKTAGISAGMMIGIGAAAAIILGGLALAGKKKPAPAHHSSGPSAVMVANRRRRARRHAFGF